MGRLARCGGDGFHARSGLYRLNARLTSRAAAWCVVPTNASVAFFERVPGAEPSQPHGYKKRRVPKPSTHTLVIAVFSMASWPIDVSDKGKL